jgi:hypothetical protein
LPAWSTSRLSDGNHVPGCVAGRLITLQPDQAFAVKLPRGFQSTIMIRWLRQDGFMVTANSALMPKTVLGARVVEKNPRACRRG